VKSKNSSEVFPMKFTITKAIVLSLASAVAISGIAPAVAQQNYNSCRRVVNIEGGPDQPRAVAGLDRNQIPVYENPGDVYDSSKSPVSVLRVGERVALAMPQSAQFVNDPNDQNGMGTQMIAIETADGQQRWIPLADVAMATGRDGVSRYTTMSKANLGKCAIRGMW
jgi:hypothetical protein